MNAILGYQRSIVWHEPGTTRDVLTATTAIHGWPIELIDTAGLRREGEAPAEPIEAAGIARAHEQIATADLVIFVTDVTAKWSVDSYCSQTTSLIVHNKTDISRPPQDGRPSGIETSALTGQGIDLLCQAIAHTLVPDPPPSGAAVPFTFQQVASLRAVLDALKAGQVVDASESLRAFPGYNHSCKESKS
jgi:tRNA modification GTPase